MGFLNSKSKKKWQIKYINNVFNNKDVKHITFSKIVLNNPDLLNGKNTHFPKSLFKFYSPTSDNIIDIKKQRLWLSHPNSFNDPFDCYTGFDITSYEKHSILEHIKNIGFSDSKDHQKCFTKHDFNRIYNSLSEYDYNWMSSAEEYWFVIQKITEKKSENFQRYIYKLRQKVKNEVKRKVEKLRETNIRVACFSQLKSNGLPPRHTDFEFMIQMWAHYASNHEGFCVEYDIAPLHPENILPFENHSYLDDEETYVDKKTRFLLSAGLFPVLYTSNRVSIPKTKLKRIKLDENGNVKNNSDIDPLLYKTYLTKSAKWSYEKEWRIIVDDEICKYFDNKVHFPFIKKIFLGCKMKSHNIDILLEIAEELNVEIFLMKMNDKKFCLELETMDSYKWKKERKNWNKPLWLY